MTESSKYRLTTIQRLAPSLEEIDFQLTKTALDDHPIESLNLSVSIEKIESQCLHHYECENEREQDELKGFRLEDKLIEIPFGKKKSNIDKVNQKIGIETATKKKIKNIKTTKERKLSIAFADQIESKIKFFHLSTTASTLKNLSPSRGSSPKDVSILTCNRKRSHTFKATLLLKNESKLNAKQKYAPYLEPTTHKIKLQVKSKEPTSQLTRRKLLSTRI